MDTRKTLFLATFISSFFFGFIFNLITSSITLSSFTFLLSASYIIGFIVSSVYVQLCLRPLGEIAVAVKEMAKDQVAPRVQAPKRAEFGEIARGLNEVSDLWQNRVQKIMSDKNELEAILSSMIEGVVVINANERIVHLSPNFRDMLELRSTNAHNRLYWEVIWNNEINASIRQALQEKKAVHKEIDIIGAKEGVFSMQIAPVVHASGHLVSVVAVFHDITGLKKLERMRTEFVANVSHELKTPLTAIKGFVETLSNGAIDDKANAKRFLEIIADQTQRLENLVNDLLILSSIESKEVKMDFKEESLEKLLNEVVVLQRAHINSKHQKIEVDIAEDIPKIKMDRQRMEQVFINLLDNAVKFTPENGRLAVKAKVEGIWVRVDILDSGIGIAPEYLSRIFERF